MACGRFRTLRYVSSSLSLRMRKLTQFSVYTYCLNAGFHRQKSLLVFVGLLAPEGGRTPKWCHARAWCVEALNGRPIAEATLAATWLGSSAPRSETGTCR